MTKRDIAPLTKTERQMLEADRLNIVETAQRKAITLDASDRAQESKAARQHFELGCWLYYYRTKIYLQNKEGFNARVDCAWRLFKAGLDKPNPGYQFFTIFEFGERQFDTIFEMGDSMAVIDALRDRFWQKPNANAKTAFLYFGWPLAKKSPQEALT